MAQTSDSRSVALPAIVDLDALDIVRDGLIEAVELGAVDDRWLAASNAWPPTRC